MPAEHTIDKQRQLIITTWEGKVQDVEFIDALKKYQNEIQNQPEYMAFNEIVNLSGATGYKISVDGIKAVASMASSTDKEDMCRKLAIVVNSTLAYGLARMYEAYRSFSRQASKEISIFKNEKDAYEWLQK